MTDISKINYISQGTFDIKTQVDDELDFVKIGALIANADYGHGIIELNDEHKTCIQWGYASSPTAAWLPVTLYKPYINNGYHVYATYWAPQNNFHNAAVGIDNNKTTSQFNVTVYGVAFEVVWLTIGNLA